MSAGGVASYAGRVPSPASRPGSGAPVVVEVRDVHKAFRIPDRKVDTLKERVTHPFSQGGHRTLHALRGVSLDVHRGEFFGIVGRNGSGKSTLLKILASIYAADAGTVRTAGRMAPFIELGVGFNPELAARENVVLNGVLMGLTRREARRRFDGVLDFAELHDFADLRLKNYSSGMMVRLAFSIMVEADADIMLIDEVLAVGDAAFGQKCMDVFRERRRAGKTILLVTHDMTAVQDLCHRAALIADGVVEHLGDPEETAMAYYRRNFEGPVPGTAPADRDISVDLNVRVRHARLLDAAGAPVEQVEQLTPIELDLLVEAAQEMRRPAFVFNVIDDDGTIVFSFTRTLEDRVGVGEEIRIAGRIENRLVPGRYFLDCWIRRDGEGRDLAVQARRLLDFHVFGMGPTHGVVNVEADVEAVVHRRVAT